MYVTNNKTIKQVIINMIIATGKKKNRHLILIGLRESGLSQWYDAPRRYWNRRRRENIYR